MSLLGDTARDRNKGAGPGVRYSDRGAALRIMRIRLLGHHLPAWIVMRAAIETTLLYFVLIAAAIVQLSASLASIEQQKGPLWPRALLFSLVMFLCFSAFGLHSGRQRARSAGVIVRIVAAV